MSSTAPRSVSRQQTELLQQGVKAQRAGDIATAERLYKKPSLREAGELDEARRTFDRAIALNGRLVHAYYHRVRAGTVAPGDTIMTAMENLKASGAGLDGGERATLGFALAKAYDDVGEYDKAFAHLLEANNEPRAGGDTRNTWLR